MKKTRLAIAALAVFSATSVFAQDITGSWQGTLHGPRDLRIVMKVVKADGGGYKATLFSIDQPGPGIPASSITLQGAAVKFAVPAIGGTYEGKLANTDGTSITGFWTQGPNPAPLDLTLANEKTAWVIPEPPPPPVPMAKDATPGFEVATIKPGVPDSPGKAYRLNGRNVSTLNTTVADLINFAYGVHPKQIIGGAGWIETEKYDIAGIPDKPGTPGGDQLKAMFRSLLADRFQLKFHKEKKELTVYAITVAKTGSKLTPSAAGSGANPSLFFRGLGNLPAKNATIAEFSDVMQSAVLDRPVVDQTGLTGRFDFQLLWTPDESQFGGRGGQVPAAANGNAPPNLFTAMQDELGLKMEATKAQVDVVVIDHVEKPSEN